MRHFLALFFLMLSDYGTFADHEDILPITLLSFQYTSFDYMSVCLGCVFNKERKKSQTNTQKVMTSFIAGFAFHHSILPVLIMSIIQ